MSNQKVNLKDIQNKIVTRGRNGSSNRKKRKSLYDSALLDRSYWGNDVGSELSTTSGRIEIRRSLRQGVLFDIQDSIVTRKLKTEYKVELQQFQMRLIAEMELECEHQIIISSGDDHKWYLQFMI